MNFGDEFIITQSHRIIQCYEACTGQSLRRRIGISNEATGEELAKALYFAKPAILSHDIQITDEGRSNIFNYANQTALEAFERTFEEQTSLISTQCAAQHQPTQLQRNDLLGRCVAKGWVQFSTERVSAGGKTIPLQDAILFNLFDEAGIYFGQAVVFDPVD